MDVFRYDTQDIQEEPQIDVRHYLRVVHKRRWTIIATFVIVLLTVAINVFTEEPLYQANARMIIEKSNPNIVSIQEVMAIDTWDPDYKETQYKIIESRSVARRVIKKLNLAESEEFNPTPKTGVIVSLKSSIRGMLSSLKKAVKGLIKTEPKVAQKPGLMSDEEELLPDSGLVSAFIGRISVSPPRTT